jgi:hypothetical protein
VQHTGENMYLAARHFINADLDIHHQGNATFFNFYGMFIYYSSSYDLALLILGLLLFLIFVGRIVQKRTIKVGSFLASFFTLLFITISCIGIVYGLSLGIKGMYPQYATFYAYHYYNHEWYLLSGVGFILFAGIQGSSFIAKKWGIESLQISVLFLLSLFSIGLFLSLSTGAYLMIIPLISTLVALLIKRDSLSSPFWSNMLSILALLLIIGIWVLLSHSLYLAFSISILAASVLPTLLFVYILTGLFYDQSFSLKLPLSILGIGLFFITLIVAHIQSYPSSEKPLLVDMTLYHHTDTNKSYFASRDAHLYFAHPEGMARPQKEKGYPSSKLFVKDITDIDFSTLISQIDTLYNSEGQVNYFIRNPRRTESTKVLIEEVNNIDSIFVDGELNKVFETQSKGRYLTHLFGMAQDSATVRIVKRDKSKPVSIELQNVYSGFIKEIPIPENALWKHPTTQINYSLEY